MLSPRFVFLGVLLLKFSYEVSAMDCSAGGVIFSCPTILSDSNAVFCCSSRVSSSMQVCCNAEEFFKENTGILAGIVVGALVLLILITLCCCCFCSCCFLAKRRLHRGTVIYGSVSPTPVVSTSATYSTSPTYQVVHAPPPSQLSSPPPYYPSANQNFNYAYQPPVNPNYK